MTAQHPARPSRHSNRLVPVRPRRARLLLAGSTAAALMSLTSLAPAASLYWDSNGITSGAGTTPNGTWGIDGFWNDQADGGDGLGAGVIGNWVAGSTAVFSAGADASGSYGVTVDSTQNIAGINVEEGDVAISGGGLDISGGAGGSTIDVVAGRTLTLTSILSGSGARLTKTGGGTLDLGTTLNLPNTFSGGVTITGGTLVIPGEISVTAGNGNAMGAAPGAAVADYVQISNGATLRSRRNAVNSSFLFANRGITIGSGGAAFDVEAADAVLLYGGKITGEGGFTKTGPGQLRIDGGLNDYAGETIVQQGTLGIVAATELGVGALRMQGGNAMFHGSSTIASPLSIEADTTISNNAAAVSGKRNMTFSSDSITGTAGTLTIRNLSTAPSTTNPPIASFRLFGGGFDFTRPIVLGDASDLAPSMLELLTDMPTPTQTFSGVISGPGIVRRTNDVVGQGGDTIFTLANTYTGGTEINGGFAGVGHDQALGTGTITFGSPGSFDDTNGLFAVAAARTLANNVVIGTMTNITIRGEHDITLTGTIDLGTLTRTITTTSTGTTTFSNTISGASGVTLTKAGAGTLVLSGTNTYDGATSVNEGKLVFGASQSSSISLSVDNSAVVEVAATANGERVIKTGPIGIGPSARIDLTNNKLVTIDSAGTWTGTSYDGVAGHVDVARGNDGNAKWNGPSGITTSDTRAINNGDLVSIGVAKVSEVRNVADGDTTTFAGQTVLGSDTLAMVTWGGDANLDGKINIDDYGRIDGNVGQSGSVFGWSRGDFNYDGKINIDDYGIIDGNINRQGTPFSTSGEVALDGVAAVPEPASLSILAMGAIGLMRRRRRG